MLRSLLVCLLLSGVALGQSTSSTPSLKPRTTSPADQPAASSGASVSPETPVITVQGLCEKPAGSNAAPTD